MTDALTLVGWSVLVAAMLALVVGALCRTPWLRRRPALRHGLWLLVLAKLIVPSLVSVAVLPAKTPPTADEVLLSESYSADTPSTEGEATVAPMQRGKLALKKLGKPAPATNGGSWMSTAVRVLTEASARTWLFVLLVFSCAVSGVLATAAIRRCRQIHRLICSTAVQSSRAAALLLETADKFQIGNPPGVKIVDADVAPMLWGTPRHAVIVLPKTLFDSFSDDQARSVIAHELAHHVRRDHWANIFAFCVTTLAWWNPVAWLARRQLAEAAEACCDALVVERLPGFRRCYAQTLLSVVDFLATVQPRPVALAIKFGESRSLRRRFETLADLRVTAKVSRLGWMLLTLAAAVSMLLPVRAQQAAAEPVAPPEATGDKQAENDDPATTSKPAETEDPVATPSGDAPAAPKSRQRIKRFGVVIDPDGDCRIDGADGGVAIVIPKNWHDLTHTDKYTKLNAPRILQDTDGDFSLEVKVKPYTFPKETSPSGGDHTFVSAGLLVWQDDQNFFRVDRASVGQTYIWVERFQNGKSVFQDGREVIEDTDTYLRATRAGNKFAIETSQDGTDWTSVTVIEGDFADKLQVGVSAINTTSEPFSVTLDGFKLGHSELPKGDAKAQWPMRVLVVDEETGEPIADSRVSLQLGSDKTSHDGDARGEVLLTLPSRTPAYCYLRARAPGYAPIQAFWRNRADEQSDEMPESFTFRMSKAITVGGRVIDEQGNPVAGASVLFGAGNNASLTGRRAESTFYDEAYTTDDDGRWQCDLAPPDFKGGSIRVNHPDFARVTGHWSVDDKTEELRAGTYEFTLRRSFTVRGRVTDPDGKPVNGAVLAVGHANWYDSGGHFPQTDADGRYEFTRIGASPGWPAGSDPKLTMTAIKPGLAPAMQPVVALPSGPDPHAPYQDQEMDFQLKRGRTVRIRVVDAEGQGIAGATVLPNEWNETRPFIVLAKHGVPRKANEDGLWEWTWTPPDEAIEYDVHCPGFMDARDKVIAATKDVNAVTITLKRPQIVSGRVIDAITRQPIDSFLVQKGFEGFNSKPDGVYWDNAQDTRGRNGTYTKTITLPPQNGSYRYRALAEGYQPQMSRSVKFEEGEVTIDFELTPLSAEK